MKINDIKIFLNNYYSSVFSSLKTIIILLFLCTSIDAQSTNVLWSAFSAGYGESASSTISIKSITGQPFIGTGSSGTSIIGSGFFYNPDAAGTITAINNFETEIPTVYELEQNYPNPFNPSTVISYQLPISSHVTLKVYDILGRELATLVNKEQLAGNYKVEFNAGSAGGGLSSGIYLYRIHAGDFVSTKKLILLR